MPNRYPDSAVPPWLSGGSDIWDNGPAGVILSADYFATEPGTGSATADLPAAVVSPGAGVAQAQVAPGVAAPGLAASAPAGGAMAQVAAQAAPASVVVDTASGIGQTGAAVLATAVLPAMSALPSAAQAVAMAQGTGSAQAVSLAAAQASGLAARVAVAALPAWSVAQAAGAASAGASGSTSATAQAAMAALRVSQPAGQARSGARFASNPTLSEALAEAYASAPVASVLLHTLEFWHPAFTQPLRVVRDRTPLVARLESGAPRNAGQSVNFTAFAFDIVPPEVDALGTPQCVIEIDNVSREILAQVEAATASAAPVEVIYRAYLDAWAGTGPENDPPLSMTVLALSANVFRLRATCGFPDMANRRFPRADYSAERFPGLIAQ